MPAALPPTGPDTGLDADFLALVCADEELLRREFDEIIAAGWPTQGRPGPPRRPRYEPRRRPARRPARPDHRRGDQATPATTAEPAADPGARQRSPP